MRRLGIVVLSAGFFLGPVIAPVTAQEEDGGGFLENLIEDNLSGAGRDVRIRGFAGALSSRASLDELTVADDTGVWLTLRDVTLDWNRAALLRGRLEVNALTAAEIIVPRLPQSDAEAPSPEATPFSLPDLPVSVRIDQVAADRVELGEPLFGAAAVVSLNGSVSLDGGTGAADIAVERVDGDTGSLTLEASFDNASENLAILLNLTEAEDGIAANLLNLPGLPSVVLNVDGEGPLADFGADITLDTDGARRLTGSVALSAEGEGDAVSRRFAADIGGDLSPVFAPQYRPFFGEEIRLIADGATQPEGGVVLDRLELTADALTLNGQVTVGADGLPDLMDVTGEIVSEDGTPVLLPVGGDETRVGRIGLAVQFDAAVSEDWTGEVTLTDFSQPDIQIDEVVLDGSGQIASDADGTRSVSALFDFATTGLAPADPGVAEALGDSATGGAEIRWQSGAPVTLDTLRLSAAGFDLEGSGEFDATGDAATARLSAALEAQDIAAFSVLAGRDLAGAAAVDLTLTAVPSAPSFDLSLSGTASDLRVDQEQLDALLEGRTQIALRADRDDTGTRLTELTLDNPALSLEASGDLTSVASNLRANLSVTDAARLDPGLSGPVALTALARQADGVWDYDLRGNGVGATITSSGTVTGLEDETPRIETETEAELADLAPFSGLAGRDLAGAATLRLTGHLLANLTGADLSVDATTRDLQTGDPRIDDLLTGRTDLAARVQRDEDTVTLPRFTLNGTGAGLRLDGQGQLEGLGSDAPLITGSAEVDAANLSRFSALAGRALGGSATVDLAGRARPDLSDIDITLTGQTRDVTLDQTNADRLLRGATDIDVAVQREGEAIVLPRLSIANPQITASGAGRYEPGASAVNADVTIADLADLDPRMRGDAELVLFAEEQGELWQITLNGDAADATLSAEAAVRDALSGNPEVTGTAAVRAGDLSRFAPLANRPLRGALEADVSGSVRADLSTLDVTATVNGRNLAIGQTEADRILGARTDLRLVARRADADRPIQVETFRIETPSLTASADGTVLGSDANLTLSARLADLAPYVPGLNGPVTAQGDVRSSGDQLRLALSGTGPAGLTLRADGSVAQDFSRADLALNGRAPLVLVNGFIEPRSLDGVLDYDVTVRGPLALSSVSGRLSAQGARFVDPGLNLVLENIALTGDLSGNAVRLNVTADKQEGGQLRASGPIALSGGYNADLTIEAAGLVVEDPRLYRTSVNGRVTVNGPLTGGARIAGLLDLGETELRIPSTGLGVTGPIPDGLVHVGEPPQVRATRERAGLIETPAQARRGAALAYPLVLTIRADNRVFIRGRGLDAEMGGALTLTGTTANIIPAGQFDLVRGRLDLLGQRLTMDEGRVTLQGDFTPFVRLVARTDAGDTVVLIVVEGSALAPDINFLSQPELPEEEVLARLLFGRSVTSISPLQAAQLASAVATLSGRGGDGLIANLRRSTGLDDLDITTDEDGNAGLRAGKYLSENLYTDVTVGSSGDAEINLNLDVTPNLTVRGGADNAGETSLGIFFEKDY